MKTLIVTSSPMLERSYTNQLADFVAKNVTGTVEKLDLSAVELPFMTQEILGINYGKVALDQASAEGQRLHTLRLQYVEQLLSADQLVIATPMWNFSVPACLKAWIDLVVYAGKTFAYTDKAPVGLVKNIKAAYVLSSRGGHYSSGPMAAFNHESEYLKSVLGFIGIKNIHVFALEGTASEGPEKTAQNLDQVKQSLATALA